MDEPLHALVLVPAIAAAAPLLVAGLRRWIQVPLVVFEIVLGILIGPDVLGWVDGGNFIDLLAEFGLAMLFFLAGYEVEFDRIKGRPLKLAGIGWAISLLVGVAVGVLISPTAAAGVLVGICLSSTALGTILPVLRDANELPTPFGASVLAIGTAGEFGPLLAVALFLSGRSPARASIVLIVFAVLIAGALLAAIRHEHRWLHRIADATLHTSGQFAIRIVVAILAALVALASALGLDVLLGAFAAGVLVNILMRDGEPSSKRIIDGKLDAVGFGFLVPIFFVNTGIGFDLDALTGSASTLALVPLLLVLFLIVRGVPSMLASPPDSGINDKLAIGLFGATGLPIIVAVTAIGVDSGTMKTSTAAALVGAGMLSVLLFPLLALQRRKAAVAALSAGPSD